VLFVPSFPESLPRGGGGGWGQTSYHVNLGMRGTQMQTTQLYSQKSVLKAAVLCYGEFCLVA